MSFNKIFRSEKQKEKQRQEEQIARLNSIIAEIQEVCSRRGVNHYELMDVLSNMQFALNQELTRILMGNFNKIKKLEDDKKQPVQDSGQKDKK